MKKINKITIGCLILYTGALIANEIPKSTDAPKSTMAPKSTDAPKSTMAIKSTDAPKSTMAIKSTDAPKSVRRGLSEEEEDLLNRKISYFTVINKFTDCIRKAQSQEELDLCEKEVRKE
jgi:hypothetical protein